MYYDREIHIRVERERKRIIEFLKEKGITRNKDDEKIDDLTLLSLTLMENELLADINTKKVSI
ncbi:MULTISPECIES: hypothetical protein [Bacillaceae]|jgi:hypothetical protein|uniref:Uncharacterized protein n=1 Tax=Niallia circulans TaxID=1397 RepID=A0A0J1HV35_NIACI|nr:MULTISPECIES: hypothetical protein [Bacillaceae]SLL35321.1 Uncharacterised protein [Mycobacteroides abscessus subsp. abscessus]HEO8421557.1 hypothetical protein [Yersinia enterocolitica]KAB7670256.1 hypothetical protein F9279_08290 [Bacillus sp. B1-b2]KLV17567.1 hypothetical protein ABW02_24615 [Niallia circulans]MCB5237174.1 hypothetical protein [Niallia circulans]